MSTISTPGTDAPSAQAPDFPMTRAADCPFDPPPPLHTLQTEAPISRVRPWDGSTPWLVTRYEDQRALLADPRISADSTHAHFPHQGAGEKERRRQSRTFIRMNDPEHARLRRMVTAAFSIKGGGAAASHPEDGGRSDRRAAGRAQAGGPGPGVRVAGALQGDLRVCSASRMPTTTSSRPTARP
jgi:hypothetical protein